MSNEAIQTLLAQGQRCGLFSQATVEDVLSQLTADRSLTPDEAAARMVELETLTPFQAERLLAGRGEECVVAGRYHLLEKIGEGGMGTVYKARDSQLDRMVAVKVLPAHRLHDAGAIARFQREARALARLSHANIVQAYDSGEDRDRHFLIMEYVEGASLAAILRDQGAIPPTLAADMIYQAALGLQHAHEKGLVHRDIKPANLLFWCPELLPSPSAVTMRPGPVNTTSYLAPAVFKKGVVKILDLGLARFFQDQISDAQLTREGTGIGTPDYMAPEQFRDALHADVRTDIYGLGCTLYHLIGGTVPFPGSSYSEKADAHARKEPIPLEERCPEVPAGLAFVVSKMMAKHPAERFQTATEVAEALAPYVAGASHSGSDIRQSMHFNAGQLTLRSVKRRRSAMAWAGGVVAAACLVGLLGLAWRGIFPASLPEEPENGLKAKSEKPTEPMTPPIKSKVVTIENGLTVAKDGTGQFRTIGEALAKVKPGMTIRVLDDGVYEEALELSRASRYAGMTLESVKGAILKPKAGQLGDSGVAKFLAQMARVIHITNVPNLTVRGFRFEGLQGGSVTFLTVMGRCPGAVFEDLRMNAKGTKMAVCCNLFALGGGEADRPVLVRRCHLEGGTYGILVDGIEANYRVAQTCKGVMVCDNTITNCMHGINIRGHQRHVLIAGNKVTGITMGGIQLEQILDGSSEVLIVNNTMLECGQSFRIWDDHTLQGTKFRICNNLVLAAGFPDFLYVDSGGTPDKFRGPGNPKEVHSRWQLDHNWRETKKETGSALAKLWVPPIASEMGLIKDKIDVLSRDDPAPDFLRPGKTSPLATSGVGGDLPSYVGAVPPEGVKPWDWDKTWKAIMQKPETKDSKSSQD